MNSIETMPGDADAVVAAARAGDESAFTMLVQRYRRELHLHCYRMLGSFTDAEDLVQETFLRAWRHRESLQGGPGLRAWLYRIATNTCLDALRRSSRRVSSLRSFAEVPWLQPYPDRLLDEVAPARPSRTPSSSPRKQSHWRFSRPSSSFRPGSGRC
ncbi:sigma-70 family RNA polymerase sigma factor [Carbonactinospora thermoautotrophica]|uniref:sigma-70 family RNA polymerase sigma factor n=1 Tax=Carbonactinospora thermoautotrophica TaxID=1469144 RepID=UPI0027DEEE1B|nr:sigma-70 family RNA polymerase sigma factor [Carbonactinospora thermoautotrophica]